MKIHFVIGLFLAVGLFAYGHSKGHGVVFPSVIGLLGGAAYILASYLSNKGVSFDGFREKEQENEED